MSVVTAEEGAKSNALMRCCKDLGIASELWDPAFIQHWRATYADEVYATNSRTNEKRRLWRKRGSPPLPFPCACGLFVRLCCVCKAHSKPFAGVESK